MKLLAWKEDSTKTMFLLFLCFSGALSTFPPVYRDNQFHDTALQGIPTDDFRAMGLVKWDADYSQNSDIVGTNTNGTQITLLQWNSDKFVATNIPYNHARETIVAITPLDFTRNGNADLLVSYVVPTTVSNGTATRIVRHKSGDPEYDFPSNTTAPAAVTLWGLSQCALPDVIAVYAGKYAIHSNRAVQKADCTSDGSGVSFGTPSSTDYTALKPPTRSPIFTVTVDLDGDLGAEVVIPTEDDGNTSVVKYAIFRSPSMTLFDMITVPAASGVPSFEDINGDGTADFVVPVCVPFNSPTCAVTSNNYTQVVFTHMMILMGTNDFTDKGRSFPRFETAPLISLNQGSNYTMGYSCAEVICVDPVPPRMSFGDYDSDSYPDVFFLTRSGYLVILHNPGDPYSKDWKVKHIQGPNVTRATWMDIGQDGRLDVLYCTSMPSTCRVLINGVTIDSLFISTYILNGVQRTTNYGTSQIGAVQTFWYHDTSQIKRSRIGTQLSFTQYGAMPMPFLFFGLGRTYSYIEEYDVGINVQRTIQSRTWLALIPNSIILVTPYPINSPSKWILELFVAPTWLLVVAIGVLVTLFLLAIPICILKYREYVADKIERQANLINNGMIF